ncbi:MAG TPA: hypothetical protein VGD94_11050 [Vicinamibacterales bacterium]
MPDETRGRFDTEIDRAVRSMMNIDPSPGLRGRVGQRIALPSGDASAPTGRGWWTAPAFAAAVLVLAMVSGVALFRGGAGDVPVASQLAEAPAPVSGPLPDDLGNRVAAPAVDQEPARTASPDRTGEPESIFGEPTQMVSAANLPASQGTGTQATPAGKPAAPANPDQAVSIKLDLTITDQTGASEPTKKVLSMIVADGLSGTIRNTGNVKDQGRVQIRAEARPKILPSGQIRLMLAVEYVPLATDTEGPVQGSALHQQISTIVEPGKPVIVTESADPGSDRKILIEVKATLVK